MNFNQYQKSVSDFFTLFFNHPNDVIVSFSNVFIDVYLFFIIAERINFVFAMLGKDKKEIL